MHATTQQGNKAFSLLTWTRTDGRKDRKLRKATATSKIEKKQQGGDKSFSAKKVEMDSKMMGHAMNLGVLQMRRPHNGYSRYSVGRQERLLKLFALPRCW